MHQPTPARMLYDDYRASITLLIELSIDFTPAGSKAYLAQLQRCNALKAEIVFSENRSGKQVVKKW
jgi:hypothetical protein